MPFTVQDFPDLLRLLDEHPEWQAELRRRILTDDLLDLPALVRRLVEAQARTDEQLADLARRLDALAARLDALTARVEALTAQVEALAAAQLRTEDRVKVQGDRLDSAIGQLLELRYERRAPAYFSPLVRKVRVLDSSALADRLDDAVEQGRLSEAERLDVLRADLVLTGQRREDRTEVYLLAEVSVGIGLDDVRRALDRAGMLARLGRPVIPVVAGQRIDPEPADLATERGVWQLLDGNAVAPAWRNELDVSQ